MELIGFVLLCIGLFITFGARRIVMGKTKLEEDKEEMELLASGIVIAIRIVGIVVVVLGFLFLML